MIEQDDISDLIVAETHYQLLCMLEKQPELSQREIAIRLGISLGKVNYCMRALAEKGWVKVSNFYRSNNKRAYLYQLTPHGVVQKAELTVRFLRLKEVEHKQLMREIEMLRREVARNNSNAAEGQKS